jgi:polyphosphate kinase 2 (PPK2 family)
LSGAAGKSSEENFALTTPRLIIQRKAVMFEAAELGRKLPKREFERRLPELRARLVQAEFALKQAKMPVIIILSGVDGAGKGDEVHRQNERLDPRGVDIHAFRHETE